MFVGVVMIFRWDGTGLEKLQPASFDLEYCQLSTESQELKFTTLMNQNIIFKFLYGNAASNG
eukprot:1684388-Amphidinium_carterae.1